MKWAGGPLGGCITSLDDNCKAPDRRKRWIRVAFLTTVLSAHTFLLTWSAWRHSPTSAEFFVLPAGVSHLSLGNFDLCRTNPPLVRTVGALPVLLLARPDVDWSSYASNPLERTEYAVAFDYVGCNSTRFVWMMMLARSACIPLSLVGAYTCYRWAEALYGVTAGQVSLVLWCFSPFILGNAPLIVSDAHAAGFGAAAGYTFWLWLRRSSWPRAVGAGAVLGLAGLTKLTFVIFFLLWPILWIVCRCAGPRGGTWRDRLREAGLLCGMFAIAVLVINVGYGFENSFKRLESFSFQSTTLRRIASAEEPAERGARAPLHSLWRRIPVPLPANYLQGIDTQKADFERGGLSYLRGDWRRGGWWYYYLYALGIKTPLGVLVLLFVAAMVSWTRAGYSAACCDELVLLFPPVAILLLASSQSGISCHVRYVFPALPFLFVWASKVGRAVRLRDPWVAAVAAALLGWGVLSALWIYPHSLAYFNELVGGPRGGYRHLSGSSLSWGQDLLYLKRWLDHHAEARPLHFASAGPFDPRLVGIDFTLPPVGPRERGALFEMSPNELGPRPGWFAIDVDFLGGRDPLSAADGKGGWEEPSHGACALAYFQRFEPVAMAGYSFYIYHLTLDEANRVRRELGLPELSEGSGS
jgi:hypothetical protein